MAEEVEDDVPRLELESIIGYNGYIPSGLICHPDRDHLIYPLGCTVIIQNINTHKQYFLQGHTNNVSCVALSISGKYVASGQVTYMGFKADIILWDYAEKKLLATLSIHKVKVEALTFSPNDLYLLSLGGIDDGSVILWNVAKREAICGSPASPVSVGNAMTVAFSRKTDEVFMTAGQGTLRIWQIDIANRKIRATDCYTGQLKRIISCLAISEDDIYLYCGTTSGDILTINVKTKLLNTYGPEKEKFSQGITALAVLKTGDFLVGSGDGKISLCKGSAIKAVKTVQLQGSVNSIAIRGQGHQFYVGTGLSQIYRFNYSEFKEELIASCHNEAINDIVFPFGTSELFATCSKSDIRVWHNASNKELLRITIPNMTCHSITFMKDGRSIISAWNDGKIRAFTPETGRLMYVIENAHSIGVTAIATTSDCQRIVSGGGEGQVRVWDADLQSHKLLASMKEHKSTVSCIKIKKNNRECVTAGADGACIIWDLVRYVRIQMILSNTLFRCVCYHPEEFQIITSGTDRKIGYWEVFDASIIRDLDGSLSGSLNGMDISPDGVHYVTGGDDKLVKVWDYNEGEVTHVGIGHSGNINSIKICPLLKCIISVSSDGAVLRWKYPHEN
uniref:Cilia- and flagella-associated protein 52 n=1 Tax=Geotrypetes seraphini TaxID=260995 RepID=A0A6P8SGG3_GEOSA|nr:cilia- and flagella-associated protein 52 [Geotrypetes seraphini]XP_033817633.1 cilia- and flagella-associated protein 52 [Geotrypetes seraphini]XP_033817634.1 cilia- and flagella-associated protein 52 [Geotrypetes seraphini]XP_033817635.1 cilia- and flagella-associated protein 52 [Geotrypetes seraphini]